MSGLGAPLNAFKPLSERYDVTEDGCWMWRGATVARGYGVFKVSGKNILAHRYFYEFWTSTRIPPGMQIDHLCNRPRCVNPAHMKVATPRENTLRSTHNVAAINARKTECNRGHPFSGDNLHIAPDGSRVCRTCKRIDLRASRDRQYAKYYTKYNAIVDEGR